MGWLGFALISCVMTCAAIEYTRRLRFDGFEVTLYRCMISGFMLLPFFSYMTFPHDLKFYLMIGLSSLIYAYGNIVLSNLAMRKNGRVAMMFQPVAIFVTFGVWLLFNPAQVAELQSAPQHLGLTGLCFVGLLLSLHFMRRNDYAWSGLIAVVPVALGFACLNVAQKWFLSSPDGGIGMILAIIMMGNFGMVIALPLLSRFRVKSSELKITHMPVFPLLPLVIIAVLHVGGWGTLMYAMQISINPAYPVAIMALSPVVFQLYYWVRGWRDNASPLAGAAMTLSAFALGLINT